MCFSDVSNRYTAHCLAMVSHMTDNQKTIFLRKVLTGDEILHMKIKYVPSFLSLTVVNLRLNLVSPYVRWWILKPSETASLVRNCGWQHVHLLQFITLLCLNRCNNQSLRCELVSCRGACRQIVSLIWTALPSCFQLCWPLVVRPPYLLLSCGRVTEL